MIWYCIMLFKLLQDVFIPIEMLKCLHHCFLHIQDNSHRWNKIAAANSDRKRQETSLSIIVPQMRCSSVNTLLGYWAVNIYSMCLLISFCSEQYIGIHFGNRHSNVFLTWETIQPTIVLGATNGVCEWRCFIILMQMTKYMKKVMFR